MEWQYQVWRGWGVGGRGEREGGGVLYRLGIVTEFKMFSSSALEDAQKQSINTRQFFAAKS